MDQDEAAGGAVPQPTMDGIREIRLQPGTDGGRSLASCYMLLAVTGGAGTLEWDDRRYPLGCGACFLIPPRTIVRVSAGEGEELRCYELRFRLAADSEPNGEMAALLQTFAGRELSLSPFHSLKASLEELLEGEQTNPDMLVKFKRHIRFQETLCWMLERLAHAADDGEALGAVELVIRQLRSRYPEEITVEQLAREAGLSVRQFNRLFKRRTGQSPLDYLTNLRMNRAKQLLLVSQDRLADIARAVGYKDPFYFNRRFKQLVGTTPLGYAAQVRVRPRIMTFQFAGDLLALGVQPAGVLRHKAEFFAARLGGALRVDRPDQLEAVVSLKPDLIIAPDLGQPEWMDRLSRIAPVAAIKWDADVYDHLSEIAGLLNRRNEAKAWLDRYRAKGEQARERFGSLLRAGESAAFLYMSHSRFWLYTPRIFRSFYEVLGFAPPPEPAACSAGERHVAKLELSDASFRQLGVDRLFLVVDRTPAEVQRFERLRMSAAWQALPAVRSGRVHLLEPKWFSYDASTLEWHLDAVFALLSPSV